MTVEIETPAIRVLLYFKAFSEFTGGRRFYFYEYGFAEFYYISVEIRAILRS